MIPILILAAGKSARMQGADKMLLQVDGMPLLRKQTLMAQATGHPVFVALGAQMPDRQAAVSGLDVTVIQVAAAAEGLSGTLRAALAALPKAQAVMLVLGDLVALQTNDLSKVLMAHHANPDYLVWRGATDQGAVGHPVVIDASLRADFARLQGDDGGNSVLQSYAAQTYIVPLPDQRARQDIDTPQDWAHWQAISV